MIWMPGRKKKENQSHESPREVILHKHAAGRLIGHVMKKTCVSSFKLLLLTVMLNRASAQSYKKIHNDAIVIDGHNDFFAYAIDSSFQFDQDLTGKSQSDLQRMKQGEIDVQVFCVCSDPPF